MTCTLNAMHPEDFLSIDEWHALLKAAQSPREAAILWLLGGAGLRVSEVQALKVEHLDPDSQSQKDKNNLWPTLAIRPLYIYLPTLNQNPGF